MYVKLINEINSTFSGRGTDTVLEYWEGVKLTWFHAVMTLHEANILDNEQTSKLLNLIISNFREKYEEFI